jgi:hypothetical protein
MESLLDEFGITWRVSRQDRQFESGRPDKLIEFGIAWRVSRQDRQFESGRPDQKIKR